MSRDHLDDLAERLFDAARDEPLPQGAVERAVAAARRAQRAEPASPWRRRLVLAGALAAAAAIALLLRGRPVPDTTLSVTAEATPPPSPVASRWAPAPSAPPNRVSAPSAAPKPLRIVPPAPSRAVVAPPSLGDEIAALKRAESALAAGNAQGAIAALDHYDRELRGSQLRAEAQLLRMDALQRSGHADQAAKLAERFVADNPGSPLVDRARSFLQGAPP